MGLTLALSCAGADVFAQTGSPSIKLETVVIDPGHGGKDAGCVSPSGKTLEKTVVLDIGKRLAAKIRDGYPDVKVIMTRSNDTFVTLQGRADIANNNNANLFISIHVNSVDGKRNGPNGYSVHTLGQYTSKNKDLYAGNMSVVQRENSVITLEDDYTAKYEGFNPNDPESYIFMNLMQNAYLEQSLEFARLVDVEMKGGAIANSRGISQDPFYVLWRTAMPAVLVECGFMSNSTDRGALITEKGRDRIASDIYDAFVKYKAIYDGSETSVASKTGTARPATGADTGSKTGTAENASSITKTETAGLGAAGNGTGSEDVKTAAKSGNGAKEDASAAAGSKADAKTQDKTGAGAESGSAAGNTGAENGGILYGTQVLVSSRVMKDGDPFFKGNAFSMFKAGKLYKYVIGVSADLETAKESYRKLRTDFPDAFLVVVEGNQPKMLR